MKFETNDCLLDIDFYELYDAVKDDKVAVVEQILAKSEKVKFEILNKSFEIPPLDHGPFNEDIQFIMQFNINRMWHLAVTYGSTGIIKLFLAENVDIFQKDLNGNNIFHVLATGAYFCPIHEQQTVVSAYEYLCDSMTLDVLRLLHYGTNDKGLRPLELAASVGAIHLFKAMMQTTGVYHAFSQPHGMYEVGWYDITEYEEDRTFMSPLTGLMSIEEHKITNKIVHEVYESAVIQHWLSMKKKSLKKFLAISIVGRILYGCMFLLFMLGKCSLDMEYYKISSEICPTNSFSPWFLYLLIACLCTGSLAHIFIDAVELYLYHYSDRCEFLTKNPKGKKNTVISLTYYRMIDVIMAISTLIYTITTILGIHTNLSLPVTVIQLNYAVALITISWSLLHFLQLHSHIGVFIMCIQRMFSDLYHFLIVFALFSVPFVYSFSAIVYEDLALSLAVNSSAPTSNPYFSNLWKSHYTVFTVILNMVNFDQIGISNNHALYFLHITFVMIVVILLMNMLIAKFSSSVALVTENKQVLLTIQTLIVMWLFESRYKWLLPSWLYKKLRSDTFPSMDGRLYIRNIKIRASLKNCHETNV